MAHELRVDDGAVPGGMRAMVPPPRRRGTLGFVAALIAAAVLGAAAVWWWQNQQPPETVPPFQAPKVSVPLPPEIAPPPIAAQPPAAPLPEPQVLEEPLAEQGLGAALATLVGRQIGLLQTDDFAHRLVATVDNLGRATAPAMLWPVHPTPGRYTVIERNGQIYASPDNGARYTPLVLLLEQLDPRAVVALYGRMLPLLQRSYEALGYPGQRFHTRLATVIDQLLATPAAPELIPLTLVEVKGDVPSERPWVRYEFTDPAFESATAGQKIMLRVGAVNERRLKAVLRAWRAELARQAAVR